MQMTKQLEDEKSKLIERKRQEQEERQRKQLELEKILEDNRRLVSPCRMPSLPAHTKLCILDPRSIHCPTSVEMPMHL